MIYSTISYAGVLLLGVVVVYMVGNDVSDGVRQCYG